MRIAVINWTNRLAGGVETYLRQAIPALRSRGHHIALVHETEAPEDRQCFVTPGADPVWSIVRSGVDQTLANLAAWDPEILYVHGLRDHEWLTDAVRSTPTVFFCHDYTGICITGTKTFRILSNAYACDRRLGWQCLLRFYPGHCGGWNPATMLRDYRRQSDRLEFMRLGYALVTASTAVREQFLKNGFVPEDVHLAPLMPAVDAPAHSSAIRAEPPWRLLFAGRMEWLKGGDVMLEAVSIASARLKQPIHLTLYGDGRKRQQWESQAERLQTNDLRIDFAGWQDSEAVQAALGQTHLLIMPSVWPEPFGLSGIEAGLHGVPVAAFRRGGIPDWLEDGVNGFMAPADPPRPEELADAIVKCLRDPDTLERLRSGATKLAQRFTIHRHLQCLEAIFTATPAQKVA